jgi:hypothetical protein
VVDWVYEHQVGGPSEPAVQDPGAMKARKPGADYQDARALAAAQSPTIRFHFFLPRGREIRLCDTPRLASVDSLAAPRSGVTPSWAKCSMSPDYVS